LTQDTAGAALAPERILGLEIGGRLFARIVAGVLAAATTAVIVAPRASPFYLGILALLAVALIARRGESLRTVPWSDALVGATGLFAIYAASSALWAADPEEAVKLTALFALAIGGATIAAAWILREDGERLSRLGLALLIGFALGLAYLAFEMLTGQALKRLLYNTFEATRPEGTKNIRIKHGLVTSIHPNTLNRQVAAMTLLAWPVLLVASLWPRERVRRALIVLLAIGVAVVVALSRHESSKVALLAGGAAFAAHRLAPLLTWRALRVLWVIATLGVVPLALVGHQLGLHEAEWIQKTGKARIVLWSVTAREAMKSPILGIGAASTKAIDDQMKEESDVEPLGAGKATPESFENRTGRHAHNVYLQTWFELGLLGALLLLAVGLILIARLARLPARAAPFAAALFASGMVLAGLSWGFWQPWFVPVFLLAGLALVAAVRVGEREAFTFFAEPHISARSRQAS
jgi:hypothetical protein